MAMSLGSPSRRRAGINVTPMIDVLLVLITIFMVIAPVTPRGLDALVPQPTLSSPPSTPPSHDIVVSVNGGGTVSLNQESLPLAELPGRLRDLYVNHPNCPLFVRAQKGLEFQLVAQVIDVPRGVGLNRIALMTH